MAQCGHVIIYLTIPTTTDVHVVSIYLPLKLILKVHLLHTYLCKSRILDEELLRQRCEHFDGPCWYCHESAEFMRHLGALHNLGGNISSPPPRPLCSASLNTHWGWWMRTPGSNSFTELGTWSVYSVPSWGTPKAQTGPPEKHMCSYKDLRILTVLNGFSGHI